MSETMRESEPSQESVALADRLMDMLEERNNTRGGAPEFVIDALNKNQTGLLSCFIEHLERGYAALDYASGLYNFLEGKGVQEPSQFVTESSIKLYVWLRPTLFRVQQFPSIDPHGVLVSALTGDEGETQKALAMVIERSYSDAADIVQLLRELRGTATSISEGIL